MKPLRRQDGAVALIAVSLTAFLILILTIAIATFMNGELQRATDNADNIKAYYDAQSAAEQAILAVKAGVATAAPLSSLNQGCSADTLGSSYGTVPGGVIVCRQVSANASTVTDDIANNDVVQYDLTNAPTQANLNIDRVQLQWDMEYPPSPAGAFTNPGIAGLGDAESAWPVGTPPVLELTATNYFPGQQTTVDPASSGSVFVVPQYNCTSGCLASYNFQQDAKAVSGNQPAVLANCTQAATSSYRCTATFYNVAPLGYKTVLRLQSRFGDAAYQMQAFDYANQQVQLPLQNAQIDVTANVGQAFSRVQLEVPVRSAVYPGFTTLYGDSSLCKSFNILTDPATGSQSAAPSPSSGICPFN